MNLSKIRPLRSRPVRIVAAAAMSLGLLASAGVVGANPGASMSVTPATIEVSAGESFTVEIVIESDIELSGAQCILTYDPAVVQCDAVEKGTFFDENAPDGATVLWMGLPPAIDNDAGSVANVAALVVEYAVLGGVTGSGTFVTAEFTGLADGETEIGFQKKSLSDVSAADALDSSTTAMVTVGAGDGQTGSDPDLVVTNATTSWVEGGATYNVEYTVKNNGGAETTACKTGVFANDTLLTSVDCPVLAAGASDSQTAGPFEFTGPSAKIEVCADTDAAIAEGNEENNCKEQTLSAPASDSSPEQTTNPADEEEEESEEAPAPADTTTPPATTGEATESGVNLPWVYVAGIGGAAVVAVVVLMVLRKNKGQGSGS